MSIEKTLDNIHATVTKNRWLQLFTAFTRILLAVGFIPPSIPKILHKPFTVLPDTNPVGHYFNALYQTGFYYEFIGWAQLIAAVLLLFPRTAHIGALMFLPIIANIAVLTSSVGFIGTDIITALMLLASVYLVAWEYDRLKPLLFFDRQRRAQVFKYEFVWLPLLFAAGGAFAASFFAYFGVGNLHKYFPSALLFLSVAGFVFGLVLAVHHRFMPVEAIDGKLR
jgi:hypothetical protein